MPDIASITGLITGLKSLTDLASSLSELSRKINASPQTEERLIELSQSLDNLKAKLSESLDLTLSVQSKLYTIESQKRELEQIIFDMKKWDEKAERYQLFSPKPGSFVYARKKEIENTDPPHWICCQCYEQEVISILQQLSDGSSGGVSTYNCSRCDSRFHGQPGARIVYV